MPIGEVVQSEEAMAAKEFTAETWMIRTKVHAGAVNIVKSALEAQTTATCSVNIERELRDSSHSISLFVLCFE